MKQKKGFILLGIGCLMLMGLLNLGFLIPFLIAVFLITKGLRLIRGNRSSCIFQAAGFDRFGSYPKKDTSYSDPLDEWEKQWRNK